MLAVRSWTGYELTQQMRRSLRFVWSSSEGHLYREQKNLVDLGWATVDEEQAGARTRKRYMITAAGAEALREWLTSAPQEPHFEIEGLVRLFHGSHGSVADLAAAMDATADAARKMLDEMLAFVDEYLADGGPLWMLEHGLNIAAASEGTSPMEFAGRPMFPGRLHVVALVIESTTTLLASVENFARSTAREVRSWANTTDPAATPATRARLEAIRKRHGRGTH
jgi:PadR family transcriptional regulator AphA